MNKQGGGLTTGEQKKVLNNNDISGVSYSVFSDIHNYNCTDAEAV